jgi:mono/diheme cytochrome c family protein
MPKFNLTDAEADTLADYIMTVYQTPAFDRDSIDSSRFTPADAEHGKELFYGKYACQSCHIVDPDKDKGYIGPTLTQTGARLNAAWIFHWLKNAESLCPGTLEPVWKSSDEDARALSAFLVAQKIAPRTEPAKK